MSSNKLYPPIVDSYMQAFSPADETSGTAACKVYFSLAKFNASSDFKNVHIAITRQENGANAINLENGQNRYRAAGIILNATAQKVKSENNLYYVEIFNTDIKNGWETGHLYKIQLRLVENSDNVAPLNSETKQAQWLKDNASFFSEWSTVCIVKAVGKIYYSIPFFDIDTSKKILSNTLVPKLPFSTLILTGNFIHKPEDNDTQEVIKSYWFKIYDGDNISKDSEPIEDTGEIYLNENEMNKDSFHYTFHTEFEDGKTYQVAFHFITINGYEGGFYEFGDRCSFTCNYLSITFSPCRLITLENDIPGLLKDVSSIEQEQDEGRIAIKLYRTNDDSFYSGNLCIRRSDSKTDFKIWEDICIIPVNHQHINDVPVFYDYTIESGVYYKYGVQTITVTDIRSKLEVMSYAVMRNFNYSFLLGKDGQQLKLMFDNTMPNFRYQIMDSKIDTIGSKYTNIARNAMTYYRTFPINGLISFWMDENKLFCDKTVIYKYEDIIELYNTYDSRNNITQYNYIYERDFRDKVLDFLQDGEFKLFKSPTEGNIIVRLMDVNCIPNQSLDRMIYSFTSNAFEMDEYNLSNCFKYNFCKLNTPEKKLVTKQTKIGQLQMNFLESDDIFKLISAKYNVMPNNNKGYSTTVTNVHHIRITFEDKPLYVENNIGEVVLGNNIKINDKIITVYGSIDGDLMTSFGPTRIYEFDDILSYDVNQNEMFLLSRNDNITSTSSDGLTVSATIDFLYDVEITYIEKLVEWASPVHNMGQLFMNCNPLFDLYNEMYYKHYFNSDKTFVVTTSIDGIEFEGAPGLAFGVKDRNDESMETHIIGATGILRLYNIENIENIYYLGKQNFETGAIDRVNADVIVNYLYTLMTGKYVEVEKETEE